MAGGMGRGVGQLGDALPCWLGLCSGGSPSCSSFSTAQLSQLRISAVSTVPRGVTGFMMYGRLPMLTNCTTAVSSIDTLWTKVTPSGKTESGVKKVGKSFGKQCGSQTHAALQVRRVTHCNNCISYDDVVGVEIPDGASQEGCRVGSASSLVVQTTTLSAVSMSIPWMPVTHSNPFSIRNEAWQSCLFTGQGGEKSAP